MTILHLFCAGKLSSRTCRIIWAVSVGVDQNTSFPELQLADATAAFPGLVVVFDASGQVTFTSIAQLSRTDSSTASSLEAEIKDLAAPALGGGSPQHGTFQSPGPDGLQSFDVTILPLNNGGAIACAHDVTLQANLQAALIESRQRYKDFVSISSDFAWETGIDGSFVFVSPRGALGHAAASLIGTDPADLVMERAPGADLPFSTRTLIEGEEVWLRHTNGSSSCLMVSAKPIYDRQSRWIGARGVCRDVTLERDRDSELIRARNRERILNHVVRTFRDEVDPQNMLRVAASTLARGLGAESCHIYRRSGSCADSTDLELGVAETHPVHLEAGSIFIPGALHGTCTPKDALPVLERLDAGNMFVDGDLDGREVLAAPCHYRHRINGAVILWRAPGRGPWGRDDRLLVSDIADQIGIANEQIAAHEDIVRLSRTDGLTGLFNRRAFFEEAERRYHRLRRNPHACATLMYLDLDNFKVVNDLHGHAAGDTILCEVRDILLSNTRPTDLVARLGGDEFALWLESADSDIAVKKAETLLARAEECFAHISIDADSPIGFSIGIAVYSGDHPESIDSLIARADQAMYVVKHGNKAGYSLAPPSPLAPPQPLPSLSTTLLTETDEEGDQ